MTRAVKIRQDLNQIRQVCELAWCFETSYCDNKAEYDSNDKSYFQCKVTTAWLSFLVRGVTMKGMVNGREHAWIVVNGIPADWTWRQFAPGSMIEDPQTASWEDLVSNDWEKSRYGLFVRNYNKINGSHS